MANIHSYDEDNISFHIIDEHAKKASLSDSATMSSLVSYLERPLEGNANHDLFLARAILVWIQSNMAFEGEAKYNTPLHHIKQIKYRRMGPADAFSNFLGAADIKYKIVGGKAKAIRYRAGDIGQPNQWIEFKDYDRLVAAENMVHFVTEVGAHSEEEIGEQSEGAMIVEGVQTVTFTQQVGPSEETNTDTFSRSSQPIVEMPEVEGKWHLMHPDWAIQAIEGFSHGDEKTLEADGGSQILRKLQKEGRRIYRLNDFWFCTAPEIFATRCWPVSNRKHNKTHRSGTLNPSDEEFNSLPDTRQDFYAMQMSLGPVSNRKHNKTYHSDTLIPSEEQFHSLPDLRQGFYAMQLSLVSENKSVISTKKGKCVVSLLANDDIAKAVEFSYELAMHKDSVNDDIDNETLRQLVLHQIRKRKVFVFEVRLPYQGTYWLRLYVGYFDQNDAKKRKCCEFKICCDTPYEDCQLYPTSCGLGVFGFTPKTENAGLTCPSESGGKLVVKPNSGDAHIERKQTLLTFNLEDSSSSIEYESELYGSDFVEGVQIEKSFTDNVETVKDVDIGKMYVNGHIPKHGEYSLIVKTVDRKVTDRKTRKPEPVACYLVTTHEDKNDAKEERTMSKEMKQIRTRNKRLAKERRKQLLIEERTQIKNELEKIKEELTANEETTLELTKIQAELLDTVKFENTIKERFPNVSVKIVSNTFGSCGPRGEVNAAETHLQNILKTITYVKKNVSPLRAKLYNREEVRLQIWEKLVNEDVTAVYEIEDGVLVVASMLLETAIKAIDMIDSLIVERSVTVDEAECSVFTSSEWRSQQKHCEKQYAWQVSIMQLKENVITVCATSNALAELLVLILPFLQSHVIVEEAFMLPANKYRLLQRHHSKEFERIETKKKVKIAFIDDHGSIKLQGRRTALDAAKRDLLNLEQRCVQEYQFVRFPGLKSFIRSDTGQTILREIEKKHQTLVVVAGSDQGTEIPIASDVSEQGNSSDPIKVTTYGCISMPYQRRYTTERNAREHRRSVHLDHATGAIGAPRPIRSYDGLRIGRGVPITTGQLTDDVTLVVYSLNRNDEIQMTMQSLNKRCKEAMEVKTIRHQTKLGGENVKRIGDIANARNVDYTIGIDKIVIKGFPSNVEEVLRDLKAEIIGFQIHQKDEELDQSNGDGGSDGEEKMIKFGRYGNDDDGETYNDDFDDDDDGEKETRVNTEEADFGAFENDSDKSAFLMYVTHF